MQQQDQTKDYFRVAAEDWHQKSKDGRSDYSALEGRRHAVISVIDEIGATGRFLDIGCGSGQLVIAAAQRGMAAEGLDFASEMIEKCELNRKEVGVEAQESMRFTEGSFFDVDLDLGAYDIISAQGFIEYFSPDDMMLIFKRCFDLLRPGGVLLVGSRNRLFNTVSFNAFTEVESKLGTLEALVNESIALHTSDSQAAAFEALRGHERMDPHPESHPATGVPVDVRYQYSPADLTGRLRASGFTPATLFPIYFHGLPGAIRNARPDLHFQLANAVAEFTLRDQRLTPFCSTFVLHVTK